MFIAGNTSTGTKDGSARRRDVCRGHGLAQATDGADGRSYENVVTDAVGDLGKRVGGAGCDEHNVGPASQLDGLG